MPIGKNAAEATSGGGKPPTAQSTIHPRVARGTEGTNRRSDES